MRGCLLRGAIEGAKAQAPVIGVLGEGDRKGAPPIEAPMGKLLFGSFSDAVRAAARTADGAPVVAPPDLDGIYKPVRSRAEDLRWLLWEAASLARQ